MASDSSPGRVGSPPDFAFAFNDKNFSDRILRIEIVADNFGTENVAEDEFDAVDEVGGHRKRRREEIKNDQVTYQEEQILNCNMSDTEDGETGVKQEKDDVAMVKELPSCNSLVSNQYEDKSIQSSDARGSMKDPRVLRVNTIHISSLILAAKSPFFYRLFSEGMREPEQRQVTLQIQASEEAALMEILNYMYSNTISTTVPSALLDILMAANKYEVASCMRYCSRLLSSLPITCESALLYLNLPGVLKADAVQSLTEAAKHFLALSYKDINKYTEEVLKLPLAGIEAVLSSDDLQVASEDAVYDLVLKWARIHYPKREERREVLGQRLSRVIRFPYMTCRKLKKALTCNDFDAEKISKAVLEALFFKAEAPYRQRLHAAEEASVTSLHRFVERAYKYRPVKVIQFEVPRQQCVVYLDLKREECANLFPSGRVYSQAFHLGGQGFFLSAHCNMDHQNAFRCFGLFLGMQEKGSASFSVDYEFSARSKPTEVYNLKYKGNYTFTGGKAVGYRNLFAVPWTSFIAEDSVYFINGVLHLRAELTSKQQ
ncbi:hypothetical protein DCAR_0209634 [Daucus carota subsp. sativus]|uniref:BTB domain-containing protein n=1 Tax=Daucus carota subsp. sativus TaxID=79200 RepID=A0AAF1AS79_DAUCS|nr:hypothetical protein DCAR_0209634 [Daucus carota subsp. sativus]